MSLLRFTSRCRAILLLCVLCAGPSWAQTRTDARIRSSAGRASPDVATAQVDAVLPSTDVTGTWFFSCCDGSAQWVGTIVLLRQQSQLRGAFLTDDNGQGSYIEGSVQGDLVRFARRWFIAGALHEQFYVLRHDVANAQLVGTFVEPASGSIAHSIHIERGFSSIPRRGGPAPSAGSQSSGAQTLQVAAPDRNPLDSRRPCDCRVVCYCGGIPPGPEVQAESMRCGSSCRCPVCPPIP